MSGVLNNPIEQGLEQLAVLAEPLRRRLYLHVAGQPAPVGRDAAATALGIARSLAAFHLDRLVEAGLLATEFKRLSGRSGPGAGRPGGGVRITSPCCADAVPASAATAAITRAASFLPCCMVYLLRDRARGNPTALPH